MSRCWLCKRYENSTSIHEEKRQRVNGAKWLKKSDGASAGTGTCEKHAKKPVTVALQVISRGCQMVPLIIGLYSLFTFESLCQSASCSMRICESVYDWFSFIRRLRSSPGKPEWQSRLPCSLRNAILWACHFIVAEMEKEYYVARLHIDFSKKELRPSLTDCLLLGECEKCWKERAIRTCIW